MPDRVEQNVESKELQARIISKASRDEGFRTELFTDPHAAMRKAFDVRIPDEVRVDWLLHSLDESDDDIHSPAEGPFVRLDSPSSAELLDAFSIRALFRLSGRLAGSVAARPEETEQ